MPWWPRMNDLVNDVSWQKAHLGVLHDSSIKRKAGELKQTYKFCERFGLEGIDRVLLEMICQDSASNSSTQVHSGGSQAAARFPLRLGARAWHPSEMPKDQLHKSQLVNGVFI